jgi:hypothetical protein
MKRQTILINIERTRQQCDAQDIVVAQTRSLVDGDVVGLFPTLWRVWVPNPVDCL